MNEPKRMKKHNSTKCLKHMINRLIINIKDWL